MLSRLASYLYWLGRYVERAEDTARLIDVNYHSLLEGSRGEREYSATQEPFLPDSPITNEHWEALIVITGTRKRFALTGLTANDKTVPQFLTFSADNPNSIMSCLGRARSNALAIRDYISSEMWETLNMFYLNMCNRRDGRYPEETLHELYRFVKDSSHLFQGVTDSTMVRREGWTFLQVGKFLERTEKTARILNIKSHLLLGDWQQVSDSGESVSSRLDSSSQARGFRDLARDNHQWIAVLKSMSAYEAYRRIYSRGIRPIAVSELLILNPIFPRSIHFSIGQVDNGLRAIYGTRSEEATNDAVRLAGRLHAQLNYQNIQEIIATGLPLFLDGIQQSCNAIGEKIEEIYFSMQELQIRET